MHRYLHIVLIAGALRSVCGADAPALYWTALDSLTGSPAYLAQVHVAAERYAANDFPGLVEAARAAADLDPRDYIAHTMMAIGYYQIGETIDVRSKDGVRRREEVYDRMIEAADAGIRAAPDRGECYFLRGLARARKSTTAGVIYAAFRARGIEHDFLTSVSRRSGFVTPQGEDLTAVSYVGLGIFYRLCPSFPFVQLLIGTRGDLEKSVAWLRKAVALAPDRIEYQKELGVSLVSLGLRRKSPTLIEEGKDHLRLVATLPVQLAVTDTVDVRHARMLLDNIGLCPGYSRDQQQELDERKMRNLYGK